MTLYRKIYFAHFIGILAVCFTCLTAVSCSDEMDLPGMDETYETVIIYMSADNSLAKYAKEDLLEMYGAVDSIPDSCRVIVYYDDGELAPAIYKLTRGSHVTWKEFDEDQNSADSAVMAATLKDIFQNFASKHYSLVLWGHGGGWQYKGPESARQKAVLVDDKSWLQVTQLRGALSVLPKLDYLMLDLCFGQNIETDYEVKDRTGYIIGSPSEIPANGAPYGKIMKALCKADVKGIVNGYASHYGQYNGDPLSVVKTDELDNLATATSKVLSRIFQRGSMPALDSIQQYAPDWGAMYQQQQDLPVPYDIRSAIYRGLKAKGLDAEYDAWDIQWQKTVLYATAPEYFDSFYASKDYGSYFRRLTDPDHFGGVGMNIPKEDYESAGHNTFYRTLKWYKAAGWDKTGW